MTFLISIFMILLLAFGYRARGGAIPLGSTQLARLIFWGIPLTLCCTLICIKAGLPVWVGACCGLTGALSAIIGHASSQGDSVQEYERMGLITTLMLVITLLPMIIASFAITGHIGVIGWVLPLGYLGTLASCLGYRTLEYLDLWGIEWCRPGDSSWEEFYIGLLAFGVPLGSLEICI